MSEQPALKSKHWTKPKSADARKRRNWKRRQYRKKAKAMARDWAE